MLHIDPVKLQAAKDAVSALKQQEVSYVAIAQAMIESLAEELRNDAMSSADYNCTWRRLHSALWLVLHCRQEKQNDCKIVSYLNSSDLELVVNFVWDVAKADSPAALAADRLMQPPKNNDSASIMPALGQPGKAEAFNKAVERRNHADYRCYQMLKEVMQSHPDIEQAGEEFGELYEELLEEANAAIAERENANELVIAIASGQA